MILDQRTGVFASSRFFDQVGGEIKGGNLGTKRGQAAGDLGDGIETVSGHLWTTHVHDNRGRLDEHLVPYAGTIDWDAAMMATQKIGFEGVLMFEVAGHGNPRDVLERTVKARTRLEKTFITF